MWYPIGFTVAANPSAALVKVNEDGTATVVSGTVEIGQGSLTVLGQIAAQVLGLAADDVVVVAGDTDTSPMDTGPIASRTTFVTGEAVRRAAVTARQVLFEVAAPILAVPSADLEAAERQIRVKAYPQRTLPIAEVAARALVRDGSPPVGVGTFNPPTVAMDPDTGQGKPFAAYVYATQIAEVVVDDETGEVEVVRITAAHDCGTAINPALVEGQIEGGIAMGLGMALEEEILFDDDGAQLNPNLTNYIIPTTLDMPRIDTEIVETHDPVGPFGAKGVGEPTLVPTAAAIANAIFDAVGVRITDLPATAEKVLMALRAGQGATPPLPATGR
ncbi:MAG TPA: molybdopterin cofactor-binding domain-containing protein [Acidimicrobiia bacterium]